MKSLNDRVLLYSEAAAQVGLDRMSGQGAGKDTVRAGPQKSGDGVALLPALLQMLNEGGLLTVVEVACGLNTGEYTAGVSESLVAVIEDELAQRGYLASLGGDYSTACDGCALSGTCGGSLPNVARARLLALTSKRQRVAGQQSPVLE